MTEAKIKIQNLYKIFGRRPAAMLDRVKSGTSKTELLEKHKAMLRAVIENSYQDGFHNNKNPGYHGIHMNRKFLYEETNIWAGSGFACSVSTVCTKFRRAVY